MPTNSPLFPKLLIANRGEIACRIVRTCKRLGISTVAVYSDADASALHVRLADEAVCIGAPESTHSYLSADKIIAAAIQTGARAVHPGYGFLSENAAFADQLGKSNLTFIGPPGSVMKKLGDKIEAKKLAAKARVPMVPGLLFASDQEPGMLKEAKDFCKQHGFPVMIKAAAGGGGRGMRRVNDEAGLAESLIAAAREAKAAFGDGRLFLERLIERARHVEVQIFGDTHGDVISLFDRDCSMQRNHQKVIEEAPAPNLSDKTRTAMHKAARDLCAAAGYVNAGTVEFLVDQKQQFYFLEVNSRLQVEHPVTEAITGLDLVELQIRIAAGQALSACAPVSSAPIGAAIECRLCAENPDENFVASTGKLLALSAPTTTSNDVSVRFDTGFEAGSSVTHYYDSMLAKLIVHAPTRDLAIAGMTEALESVKVCGVRSNIGFLNALVRSHEFKSVSHDTHFARSVLRSEDTLAQDLALVASLPSIHQLARPDCGSDAWQRNSCFRISGRPQFELIASVNGKIMDLRITPDPSGKELRVQCGAADFTVLVQYAGRDELEVTSCMFGPVRGRLLSSGSSTWVMLPSGTYEVKEQPRSLKKSGKRSELHSGLISSPLPGKVAVVKAQVGSKIAAGEPILVIESMKMEHIIRTPHDAEVKSIRVRSGDVVEANATLAELQFSE